MERQQVRERRGSGETGDIDGDRLATPPYERELPGRITGERHSSAQTANVGWTAALTAAPRGRDVIRGPPPEDHRPQSQRTTPPTIPPRLLLAPAPVGPRAGQAIGRH